MKNRDYEYVGRKPICSYVLFYLIMLVLVTWNWGFISRGIDLADTSYYMAKYKWCFERPELIGTNTAFSNLTGGIIYHLFPSHQLLILRILDAAANLIICLCIYKMVGKKNNWLLLLGMLAGSLFLKIFPMTLSYNTFSTLFAALAMWALVTGLRKEKLGWIAAAGFLAGINVFYRTPNLTQVTMALGILLYGWLSKWKGKQTVRYLLTFFAMYLLALVSGFLILVAAEGLDRVIGEYLSLAERGSDPNDSHNISYMVAQIVETLVHGGFITLGVAILSALASGAILLLEPLIRKLQTRDPEKTGRVCRSGLMLLAGLLIGYKMLVLYQDNFSPLLYHLTAAACLTGLISILAVKKLTPMHAVLGYLLGSSVFYVALGTDNGLVQFVIFGAAILGLTVELLSAISGITVKTQNRILKAGSPLLSMVPQIMAAALLLEAFAIGGPLAYRYTFGDYPAQVLTEPVDIPVYAGMKTNPSRAQMLETLYAEMQDPAMEGRYLANTENMCAVYVIFDNPPFFDSVWPGLPGYSLSYHENDIRRREEKGELPIMILMNNGVWWEQGEEKATNLWNLAEKYDYACIYNHDQYQILVPRDCYEEMGTLPDYGLHRSPKTFWKD